jgi:hypothetical protein
LSSLKGLSSAAEALDSLDVSENPLHDFKSLPSLPNLSEILACNCCQLNDLAALTHHCCPKLACLDVRGSMLQGTDVELKPLAGLTSLVDLSVGQNTTKTHGKAGCRDRLHSGVNRNGLWVTMTSVQHLIPHLERFNGKHCCQKGTEDGATVGKASGMVNAEEEQTSSLSTASTDCIHVQSKHGSPFTDRYQSPLQSEQGCMKDALQEDQHDSHTMEKMKDFMNTLNIAGCPLQHLRALSGRRKVGVNLHIQKACTH